MARHLAPATRARLIQEDYAGMFPHAAAAFDTHRHTLGLGKHDAATTRKS